MKPQPQHDYPISVVRWETEVEPTAGPHYLGIFEVHLNYQVSVLVADLSVDDAERAAQLVAVDPDDANGRDEAFRAALAASDAAIVVGEGAAPSTRRVSGQPWLTVPREPMLRLLKELDHGAGGFRDGVPRSAFPGQFSAELIHRLLMSSSFPRASRALVTTEQQGSNAAGAS